MPNKKIPLEQREHGLRTTYNAGCRCQPCKDSNKWYAAQWRWKSRKAGYRFNEGRRIYRGEIMFPSEVPFDV